MVVFRFPALIVIAFFLVINLELAAQVPIIGQMVSVSSAVSVLENPLYPVIDLRPILPPVPNRKFLEKGVDYVVFKVVKDVTLPMDYVIYLKAVPFSISTARTTSYEDKAFPVGMYDLVSKIETKPKKGEPKPTVISDASLITNSCMCFDSMMTYTVYEQKCLVLTEEIYSVKIKEGLYQITGVLADLKNCKGRDIGTVTIQSKKVSQGRRGYIQMQSSPADKFKIDVTSVPFKVFTANDNGAPSLAIAGVSNLGFYGSYGLRFQGNAISSRYTRYFPDGRTKNTRLALGLFVSPAVNSWKTGPSGAEESTSQLFLSTGLAFSYSVNGVSFIVVPFGYDFNTNTVGRTFPYRANKFSDTWWGFGVGLGFKTLRKLAG